MAKTDLMLEEKIANKDAIIGVIGLGYVGLPLVKTFLKKGFKVIGFDVDQKKISLLNRSRSYINHVTGKDLKPYIKEKKFLASTDFKSLQNVDVIIICVPTPLDAHRNPDLSYVLNTTKTIATYLRKGQLIVLESTTYPGTTEEEILPILESGGLKVGRDFYLAYSPEREDPGNETYSTAKIPKVVGGVTANCRRIAKAVYDQIVV